MCFAEVIKKSRKLRTRLPAKSGFNCNFITLSYYTSNPNEFSCIRIDLPKLKEEKKNSSDFKSTRDDTRQIIIDFKAHVVVVVVIDVLRLHYWLLKMNESSHTILLCIRTFFAHVARARARPQLQSMSAKIISNDDYYDTKKIRRKRTRNKNKNEKKNQWIVLYALSIQCYTMTWRTLNSTLSILLAARALPLQCGRMRIDETANVIPTRARIHMQLLRIGRVHATRHGTIPHDTAASTLHVAFAFGIYIVKCVWLVDAMCSRAAYLL